MLIDVVKDCIKTRFKIEYRIAPLSFRYEKIEIVSSDKRRETKKKP